MSPGPIRRLLPATKVYRENGLLNHPIGENKTRHFSRIPPPHCFPLPKGLVAIYSGALLEKASEAGRSALLKGPLNIAPPHCFLILLFLPKGLESPVFIAHTGAKLRSCDRYGAGTPLHWAGSMRTAGFFLSLKKSYLRHL